MRTSCWDTAVEALSTPQLLEDVAFHEKPLPPPGAYRPPVLEFTVGDSHVERASANYLGTLRREGLPLESAAPLAAAIAHSLSGLACGRGSRAGRRRDCARVARPEWRAGGASEHATLADGAAAAGSATGATRARRYGAAKRRI